MLDYDPGVVSNLVFPQNRDAEGTGRDRLAAPPSSAGFVNTYVFYSCWFVRDGYGPPDSIVVIDALRRQKRSVHTHA